MFDTSLCRMNLQNNLAPKLVSYYRVTFLFQYPTETLNFWQKFDIFYNCFNIISNCFLHNFLSRMMMNKGRANFKEPIKVIWRGNQALIGVIFLGST